MRMWTSAVAVLSVSLMVACANRSDTDTASSGSAGGAQAAPAARMTPAQLETTMKGIAQANGSLQKNLKGNMLPEAAKDAQQLATLFGDVERFWTQHNRPDAVKLAQTARTGASGAAGAAGAGDAMKATQAAASIAGTCKECHTLYREGDAKTGYQIKPGTITP